MKATELLQVQMTTTKMMTAPLIEDLASEPLAAPTAKGGNHALWIAGHLVFSEAGLVNFIAFGRPNPLEDWKEKFGRGSEPQNDAAYYGIEIPAILAKWDEVREATLAELAKLTDGDLDTPAANCPPERDAFFGTLGKVLTAVATHPLMHRGQLADSRRALGRPPLMA